MRLFRQKKKRQWSLQGETGERENEERREPFSGKGLPSALVPRSRGTIHTTLPKALETKKERLSPQSIERLYGVTFPKLFARLFVKGGAIKARSLVALRRARNLLPALFFLLSFFFCASFAKRKSGWGVCRGKRGEREKEGDFSGKVPLLLVFRARAENFTSAPQKLLKQKKKGWRLCNFSGENTNTTKEFSLVVFFY